MISRSTVLWVCSIMLLLTVSRFSSVMAQSPAEALQFFAPDDQLIRYTGRVDLSEPSRPRFWQPGVYVEWMFEGSECEVIVEDEVLWGSSHNYLQLVVDGTELRCKTRSHRDTITLANGLGPGTHKAMLVKNTEAGIGYLSLLGIRCNKLVPLPARNARKIEFIGNSITCGMGSDESEIACDKGVWYDQHNAYKSYGAVTARALTAQYHLSAVSGIGLMRSCCEMKIIMPQVFDKVNMRQDTIAWDFQRYQPDVVTVCLGQNDGIQDSVLFCRNYLQFLQQLRHHYPAATIVCLSSPMADEKLAPVMKNYLTAIVREVNLTDRKVHRFFFSRRYHHGCGQHPSLKEHELIAGELTGFLKKIMKW